MEYIIFINLVIELLFIIFYYHNTITIKKSRRLYKFILNRTCLIIINYLPIKISSQLNNKFLRWYFQIFSLMGYYQKYPFYHPLLALLGFNRSVIKRYWISRVLQWNCIQKGLNCVEKGVIVVNPLWQRTNSLWKRNLLR